MVARGGHGGGCGRARVDVAAKAKTVKDSDMDKMGAKDMDRTTSTQADRSTKYVARLVM